METLPFERMEEKEMNLDIAHDDHDAERNNESETLNKESNEKDNLNEKSLENESTKKHNKDRKIQNLRKNIKDLLENTQLDEATVAAQKLESERLSRVQEAQRLLRESQRQMLVEKQAIKTQQKVLSLLGEKDEDDKNDVQFLEESELSRSDNSKLYTSETSLPVDNNSPSKQEPDSKFVIIDSDSDDCIILSDDDDDEDEIDTDEDESNSGEHTNDSFNKAESDGGVIINIGHKGNESKIYIAPQIARVIKPHQIGGIRFLFDNIIESVELFDKSSGFGCILAHSMGLGKTLQIVCFCDVLLRHTTTKNILIIMPINTIQNWLNEFNLWTPAPKANNQNCGDEDDNDDKKKEIRPRHFKIFVINDTYKTFKSRVKVVLQWKEEGGVLMMGYEMFRLLSLNKLSRKRKRKGNDSDMLHHDSEESFMTSGIYESLVNPGPSVIICDEGHRIKNASASISLALKQVKTKRRIVLTGYPLQNNLLEYWCMIDFARPDFLGSKAEFLNMFERPIQNGQCIDSTPQDKKLMRYRAHVLHSLLKGFVQRRSQNVLQKCLPEKEEYVLFVRMTTFQRKLYDTFMNEVIRSKKVQNPLKAFAVCCKIWNHPDVLYNFLKKKEFDLEIELEENETVNNELKKEKNENLQPKVQNIQSVSTQNVAMNYNQMIDNAFFDGPKPTKETSFNRGMPWDNNSLVTNDKTNLGDELLQDMAQNRQIVKTHESSTTYKHSKDENVSIPYDWAADLMKDYTANLTQNSPKVEIFLCILEESVKVGDRMLLFSQSLLTLNLLEQILSKRKVPNIEDYWAKNKNYFRLDGSTLSTEREKLINEFNCNENYKLFLVSTRAGSLGINLVGASRVIIFDASWNPCHDQQAICRVYRYGQMKRCIIYRLVADDCLEKRIYDRQINKQGIADRIVDECNPDAHLSIKEVTSLCFDEIGEQNNTIQNFSDQKDDFSDKALQKILCEHSSLLAKLPFEHETLLVDRKEKKLSQAEKRLAKKGYEMEKQASNKCLNTPPFNSNYRLYRTSEGTLLQRPFLSNTNKSTDLYNQGLKTKSDNPRPNRWIPVEVWQSKGITAHEMTLPQDVSIQTNSADKSKIFLKAGQKVIVLKSPRGICLQLESGKVIAIRASTKIPQQESVLNCNKITNAQSTNDIIDMTNDDDDDVNETAEDSVIFKEKPEHLSPQTQFRPNIVQRKIKNYNPPSAVSNNNLSWSSTSHNQSPNISNNHAQQLSAKTSNEQALAVGEHNQRNGNPHSNFDTSAFHAPSSESLSTPNPYTPYYSNHMYPSYDVSNMFQPTNYNYYQHPSYSSHPSYNYTQQSNYNSHYAYRNVYPSQYAENYPYAQPGSSSTSSTSFPPSTTANFDEFNFK